VAESKKWAVLDELGQADRGPALLAQLIQDARQGLDAGEDPQQLAERLWPQMVEVVAAARAEVHERMEEGLQAWLNRPRPTGAE
jgi:hypothetical protein